MRRAALALALVLVVSAATAARSEVLQRGPFRVGLKAALSPTRLPRSGSAPVSFSLGARFIATHGDLPPQLRTIRVEINRHGILDPAGIPVCEMSEVQPSKTSEALRACGSSLIGEGQVASKVSLVGDAPFPSKGKLLAFNGTWRGRPAILAHIYGSKPVPTSYTIPFTIGHSAHGNFGTVLSASLPRFSSKWGYVTSISMTLGRTFKAAGKRRSYLSAGCPAPKGFAIVSFPLSRTSFAFAGHRQVRSTLIRTCRVRS